MTKYWVMAIQLGFLSINCQCPTGAKIISESVNDVQNKNNNVNMTIASSAGVDVPIPPAVALPDPDQLLGSSDSVSLAWRSRALALANEYPLNKDSLVWIMPVKYSKGQSLLEKAIKQIGLELLSEYPESGQFLLSMPDNEKRGQIIIVSQPVADNKTLFRMRVYSSGGMVDSKKVNALPATMRDLLENKDLWQ